MIYLNILKVVKTCFVTKHVIYCGESLWTLEKNVCSAAVEVNVLYITAR